MNFAKKKRGHSKNTCFKIHVTPEWFKELVEKKPILKANNAGQEDINKGNPSTEAGKGSAVNNVDIKELIRAEVQRMMASTQESLVAYRNIVFDYAGSSLTCHA